MKEKRSFNIVWIALFMAVIMWLIAVWNIIKVCTIIHFNIAILCTIWIAISILKIKKSRAPRYKIIYLAGRIMLVYIFWFMSFGLVSFIDFGLPYQYSEQKNYAEESGYDVSFFPERLPKKVSDYEVQLFPSIMQGSGWMLVSFKTDTESIREYKEYYSKLSVEILSVNQYLERDSMASLKLSEELENNSSDCMLYIISDNKDWNHPRKEIVIINEKLNIVQFLGM